MKGGLGRAAAEVLDGVFLKANREGEIGVFWEECSLSYQELRQESLLFHRLTGEHWGVTGQKRRGRGRRGGGAKGRSTFMVLRKHQLYIQLTKRECVTRKGYKKLYRANYSFRLT